MDSNQEENSFLFYSKLELLIITIYNRRALIISMQHIYKYINLSVDSVYI